MRIFFAAFAGLVLLAGCAKKDVAPLPDPAPEATLARTLTFPTAPSLSNDTTYTAAATVGAASLNATELTIGINPRAGRDGIGFRVPRAALAAGLVGSYRLLDQAKSQGAVAYATYIFTPNHDPTKGNWLIYGETDDTRGQVQVTAYDASRQLISGTYEMAIDNMQNLLDKYSVPNAPPLCNLRVSGTFTNLKIQ